ncbi:hypothetical protein [Candidatus Pseudomonas adelgestsugas]
MFLFESVIDSVGGIQSDGGVGKEADAGQVIKYGIHLRLGTK